MTWLLDTNVVSELMTPRPSKKVLQWIDEREKRNDHFYLSAFTIAELRRGVLRLESSSEKYARLMSWIAHDIPRRFHGRVLGFDEETARHWADMVNSIPKGAHISPTDSFIAAIARQHELGLVTRNVKDVVHFEGVNVENPWGN